MNRILAYVFGTVQAELISADPAAALTYYGAQGLRLREPELTAPLTLTMTMDNRTWRRLEQLAQSRGDRCRCLSRRGLAVSLARGKRRLPFWIALAFLFLAVLYAPNRVWFVEVEGNGSIPDRQILAAAQACGVRFWAKAGEIRSEQVKNKILNLVPELQWAGVNFSGGVAIVSVRERLPEEAVRDRSTVTNVVAARDGVIVSMSVLGGQSVCRVGQAVRAGELLVTGCVDQTTHTQYTHADAEIYALTQRTIQAVYPQTAVQKVYTGQVIRRYSLIVGRKRINLSGNSGISDATCDKMTETKTLSLPGGYSLPVKLEIETLRPYRTVEVQVSQTLAEDALCSYARQAALSEMIAGEILGQTPALREESGLYWMDMTYACREMIARQRPAELFEGESTND